MWPLHSKERMVSLPISRNKCFSNAFTFFLALTSTKDRSLFNLYHKTSRTVHLKQLGYISSLLRYLELLPRNVDNIVLKMINDKYFESKGSKILWCSIRKRRLWSIAQVTWNSIYILELCILYYVQFSPLHNWFHIIIFSTYVTYNV